MALLVRKARPRSDGIKDDALSLGPPTQKRLGAPGLVRTHLTPIEAPMLRTLPSLAVRAPQPHPCQLPLRGLRDKPAIASTGSSKFCELF